MYIYIYIYIYIYTMFIYNVFSCEYSVLGILGIAWFVTLVPDYHPINTVLYDLAVVE